MPGEIAVNPLASLPAPPPVLPAWAKVLYYVAETIAIGVGYNAFDFGAPFRSAGGSAAGVDAQTWRRFVTRWRDVRSGDAADDQLYTTDLVNLTGGEIDSSWTTADYDQAFANLNYLAVSLGPNISNTFECHQIDAYIMAFRPYSDPKPFALTGPPDATYQMSNLGGGDSHCAPQPCTTITEMTASRKHWGRFYSPTLGVSAFDPNGRLNNSRLQAMLVGAHQAYANLMGNQLFPVVPTTQVDKQPVRTLQTVSGLRMDDVTDVQRSRRIKQWAVRSDAGLTLSSIGIGTLPAPDVDAAA